VLDRFEDSHSAIHWSIFMPHCVPPPFSECMYVCTYVCVYICMYLQLITITEMVCDWKEAFRRFSRHDTKFFKKTCVQAICISSTADEERE
jgi:hypothetical protein